MPRKKIHKVPTKVARPEGYFFYDRRTRTQRVLQIEDLRRLSEYLPIICQQHIKQTTPFDRQQQDDLLLLLSLSIDIWGGSPKGRLPEVHMDDYTNSFYIRMISYIEKFDRSKGNWVSQCKFIAYDTVYEFISQFKRERKVDKAILDAHQELMDLYPEAFLDVPKVEKVDPL
jgi:hypothetical protein